MSTLEQLCALALAREASQPAIEFDQRWIDWGSMRKVAERLRALIAASGVAPHAPIAFVPRNRPSAVAALLGLIADGYSIRMLYAFQSSASLARDIERLQPAIIVAAAQDFSPELLATLQTSGIAAIALSEMDAVAVTGLVRSTRISNAPVPPQRQIEILTSGTTGPPKQFAITFDLIARHFLGPSLTQSGTGSAQSEPAHELPPALLFMPLGNISGIYSTVPIMLKGQRAVLLERFTVAGWHDHILRYRPQISGLPPAGVQMVLDSNVPPADLVGIRSIGSGAAALDPTAQKAFEARYKIPILLSYGATEFAGPVTAMTIDLHARWGEQKFGSVGRALPGAQLRVIDPDTGTVLPPGKEGILEVISPRIGPQWIRTNDIVLIDEDGFMFHRGRADGAIMRGGFKLLPEIIERALLLHEAISAAAVLGLHDRRLGQVPAAAISIKPDATRPSIPELETHLRQHVYATHIPVTWRFVDDLPRTPSLKIDRPALRALFETSFAPD
jgi:long-chain acyl-CoA synthetase